MLFSLISCRKFSIATQASNTNGRDQLPLKSTNHLSHWKKWKDKNENQRGNFRICCFDRSKLFSIKLKFFYSSHYHSTKRTWSKPFPSQHSPSPNNFHLIPPFSLHHRFFFQDKSPHQNIIGQRFSSENHSSSFHARSRTRYSFLHGRKWLRPRIAIASSRRNVSSENLIVWRDWCAKTNTSKCRRDPNRAAFP